VDLRQQLSPDGGGVLGVSSGPTSGPLLAPAQTTLAPITCSKGLPNDSTYYLNRENGESVYLSNPGIALQQKRSSYRLGMDQVVVPQVLELIP
jgi:hypothetical protein